MKTMFLVTGLLACAAFSPQPAFSAPDTGPKVDNEVFQEFSPAGVSEIDYQIMDNGKKRITLITFTNGREAVPEQSDHPIANKSPKEYLVIDEGNMVATENGNLLNSDVNISALVAVDDRQRSCNSMIMNGTVNLDPIKNSAGLAAITAIASGNLRHSVAWVTSYLSGSESRL